MGAPLHPTTRADAPADAAGSATSIREEFDLAQGALFTGYRTAREGADLYRGGDPVGAASRRRVVARLQAVELDDLARRVDVQAHQAPAGGEGARYG